MKRTRRSASHDEVCRRLHQWEQRCFAAIRFLGALALLILLIILEAGLIVKSIEIEFGPLASKPTVPCRTELTSIDAGVLKQYPRLQGG
jgi:hypothetical protein